MSFLSTIVMAALAFGVVRLTFGVSPADSREATMLYFALVLWYIIGWAEGRFTLW